MEGRALYGSGQAMRFQIVMDALSTAGYIYSEQACSELEYQELLTLSYCNYLHETHDGIYHLTEAGKVYADHLKAPTELVEREYRKTLVFFIELAGEHKTMQNVDLERAFNKASILRGDELYNFVESYTEIIMQSLQRRK